MKASFFKRIGAYLIDCFLLMILLNFVSRYLPGYNKIQKLNIEGNEIMEEYTDAIASGDTSLLAEKSESFIDFSYELRKLSIYSNLSSIVLYSLYFIVFQRYNNGQTVGKKLLKVEVIDEDGNSPSLKQMVIRTILIHPIVFDLIDVILVLVLSKSLYLNTSNILVYAQYILFFVCAVTAIFGKGLHDRLAHTNVIKFGTISEVEESKVSKWKKTSNREREIKTYRVNHTSGKRKE